MIKRSILLGLSLFACTSSIFGQVSVVSIQLPPFNVTPETMQSTTILNNGNAIQVEQTSKLYNFNNELLLTVKTSQFNLKGGLNLPTDGSRKIASVVYGSGNQAEYIKTSHGLPNGNFKICVNIISTGNIEQDEFCDEIVSDFNQFLYLVYPGDKDTIESAPMLTWTHSEPFSVLAQGEYFRMIVTEIKDKQGPDEAIAINSPVMIKNYLTSHSLQYPFDAPELKKGVFYAWQVQKITNGVIINKTEAWSFILRNKPIEKELKYVALKQSIDANYYTTYTGKVYFKFNEEYATPGVITAFIIADSGEETLLKIVKDDEGAKTGNGSQIKVVGDNRFILDLDQEKLKPGFYTMKIKNEKKEIYYLKLLIAE